MVQATLVLVKDGSADSAARRVPVWRAWVLASRPKTLPAAAAPVIVGSAAAFAASQFRPGPACACLVGALLLQVGANFVNDYADFVRGADTVGRLGPMRVTQAGLLRPRQVLAGTWIVFGLATLAGVYLAAVAGWPVVAIGVASIAAAWAYTAGPFPLGYHGLGELFVFVFFGLAAVCGTFYVQAGTLTEGAVFAAVPIGLLAVAILAVNNLRDIATDRAAGKRTLAARFGTRFARGEFIALVGVAFAVPVAASTTGLAPKWVLLSLLALPAAAGVCLVVARESGRSLNRALAITGGLELAFAVLYSVGLILGR
jgi:1,4-dihydroxy-2-naphthoate octaprenyltransferase